MSNTRRAPFVAVALLLIVAALGLTACGSGGGSDPDKVVKETFSGNKKVTSGKVSLKIGLEAQGGAASLGGPLTVALTGPFQSQGPKTLPKFDFDLNVSVAGRTFAAGAVSTGDAGFLKFQNENYSVPDSVFAQFKQGFENAQSQSQTKGQNQSFASLGIDPSKWLTDAKSEGDADVAGTSTNHVSATVDMPKLLDDVNQILSKAGQLGATSGQQIPSRLTPQQRQAVQDAIQEATLDVYSGKDDKTLRRLTITVKFKVPQSAQASAQGLTGGTVTFDLTLSDLNQPQTIQAPANPKSFDELTKALRSSFGGLLGAAGGAGGAGGSTGSGGTTSTPSGGGTLSTPTGDQKAQDYAKCIQQAGGDITKAQKCSSILTGG